MNLICLWTSLTIKSVVFVYQSLKHFRQVLESYPETPWFVPSLFWSGQLLVLDGKYDLALDRLKTFEREASKINFPFQKDFLDRSRYTRIWIDLKQERSSEELLPMLKQTVEEVQEQGIKFKLFGLAISYDNTVENEIFVKKPQSNIVGEGVKIE